MKNSTKKQVKSFILTLSFALFMSCSSDENSENILNSQSYLYGTWKVTEKKTASGENLQILCSNGEVPTYTFTSNNELNTSLFIGSTSNIGPCQQKIVFYNYNYNPSTKILTYRNPPNVNSNSEYISEIIEINQNKFVTKYISGSINMQTSVPNHITVYERVK